MNQSTSSSTTRLSVEEYVKTQFAGAQTHVEICELLRAVEPWFERFEVADEGEFWESADRARLEMHMSIINSRLQELANESKNAEVAVRLPSGRIVDLRHDNAGGTVAAQTDAGINNPKRQTLLGRILRRLRF